MASQAYSNGRAKRATRQQRTPQISKAAAKCTPKANNSRVQGGQRRDDAFLLKVAFLLKAIKSNTID